MKQLIFLAIVLLGTFGTAIAQKQKTETPQKTEKKAVSALEWTNPNANLGNIPKGVPATATYEFVNKGDKPVVITRVKPSCGCTSRSYPKEPIKPGEKATVTATYNAAVVGNFNKSIIVTTNEGATPKVLRIRGTVIADNTKK